MQLHRIPSNTRVATAWLRRAAAPSKGAPFAKFLKEQGSRKVQVPGRNAPVTLNTLHGSDKPADQLRVSEEYEKWRKGQDSARDSDQGSAQDTSTPEKLKRVQQGLVDYAKDLGVPEDEARELVKGMSVGDTPEDIATVEANIEKLGEKVKGEKEDSDKKTKEKEETEAKAKAEADAKKLQEAEAKAKAAEAKAREEAEAEAEAEAIRAEEEARRKGIADRVTEASTAVAAAEAELAAAKKSKDKPRIQKAKEALNKALDEDRYARLNAGNQKIDDLAQELSELEGDYRVAQMDMESNLKSMEDDQARLAQAQADGNTDEVPIIEQRLKETQAALDELDETYKGLGQQVEALRLSKNEELRNFSKEQFDLAWSDSERNRGILLYDAEGNASRYDPDKWGKVDEIFQTLLGEHMKGNGYRSDDKHNFERGRSSPKDKNEDNSLDRRRPTKSGRPRNQDGTSPSGLAPEKYGPGEVWSSGPNRWSAKNRSEETKQFNTLSGAKNYARTAASRVASLYLRGLR